MINSVSHCQMLRNFVFVLALVPWARSETLWNQPQSNSSVLPGHYPHQVCHLAKAWLNSTDGKFYVFGELSVVDRCKTSYSKIWTLETQHDAEPMQCDEVYDNGHTFATYYRFGSSNYYHLHYDMMFPLFRAMYYQKTEAELKATRLLMPVVETTRLKALNWDTIAFDDPNTYWYEVVELIAGKHPIRPFNRKLRDEKKTICFDNIYVGTANWNHQDEAFVKAYVAHMKSQVGGDPSPRPLRSPPKVALISRKNRRRILNEEDLLDAVKPFADIDLVDFVGKTVKDQILSMHEYDVVVGINGAGLMNGIFMPPHGTIVQLVPYQANLNHVQYGLLLMSRGPYLLWHNTHEDLTREIPRSPHRSNSDTIVHVQEFVELIQKAIAMAEQHHREHHDEL